MHESLVARVLRGEPVPPEELDDAGRALLLRNGLLPLWIGESLGHGVPAEAFPEPLLARYHAAALHGTLLMESAERALAALDRSGIPALLFKGAALVRQGVYSGPGLRPAEDVDLLVPPESAPEAVAALREAGFLPWQEWEARRMEWVSSASFSDSAAPSGVSLDVDLHWSTPYTRLRQGPPWGQDPLWEGARPPYPSPAAHLAAVAEHVLKHLRVVSHLRGIGDLVRLLPTVADPWELRRQAERRGSRRGLEAVLAFLSREVGVPLPSDVLEALPGAARPSPRSRRVLRLQSLLDAPEVGGGMRGLLDEWLLLQSPSAAARELFRVLVPPGRWLAGRYGEGPGLRRRYLGELLAWSRGRGPSPLSPNQEWE